MADLTIPCSDYGFTITFTCQDSDGNAFNLTGYTAYFRVWSYSVPATVLVNGLCVVIPPATDGICTYAVASGNFSAVGLYRGEIELTKVGARETFTPFDIEVVESVA